MIQQISGLFVGDSTLHGLGVFTAEEIQEESLIEICQVIELPKQDVLLIKQTHLNNYYFEWGEDLKRGAIALGNGSIYNHAYDSNAYYEVDYLFKTISIYARRKINALEEITINYNGNPDDKTPVWFQKK